MSERKLSFSKYIFGGIFLFFFHFPLFAQIDNDGCVAVGFGVDADVYSDMLQFGNHSGVGAVPTYDWFTNPSGGTIGVIDESNTTALQTLLLAGGNPFYETRMNAGLSSINAGQIWIDGLWSREYFGGTGFSDQTSFATASKNGEDPAIWDPGVANVLGKNDLVEVAGHMRRDGTTLNDDLWFYGVIVRAEPGGAAYMDFEFFVEEVHYDETTQSFNSGGPDLGHTAFEFDAGGNIIATGDIIFNCALVNGGSDPQVEMRLWVSKADYENVTPAGAFTWGPEFDGAFNGSPFGYASIIPVDLNNACGIVNMDNQNPSTPPWGALGTKTNSYITSYNDFAFFEIGLNMTAFGIDNSTILGTDPCDFPLSTFMVKTRASASFTAQLKDFAGPYGWGQPMVESFISGDPLLSCFNQEVTLIPSPPRTDVDYLWTTIDGKIDGDPTEDTIKVTQAGTYNLTTTLPTTCAVDDASITVDFDLAQPFFESSFLIESVACNGNDGTIDLTPQGATAPYIFKWSTGATSEDLTGLSAGTYIVTITDNIGCIRIDTALIAARVPTTISTSITPIDCDGNATGAIDLSVTGQSPFTYQWSNGATTEDLINLTAGTYTLTVTDSDGCIEITSHTVTAPNALTITGITTDESDPTLNDGTIDFTVSGGTTPYTYDWDNDGPEDPDNDTQDLNGLAAGVYTVTVTDFNACTSVTSFTIYEPEICNDGIDNDGDGLSDCSDSDCTPTQPGAITTSNPTPCIGDTGVTYSIAAVADVTNYVWMVPAGATITAGQGTTSITVDWTGSQGGQLCVQSDNVGCLSPKSCTLVVPDDVPNAPATIIINNN